MKLLVLICLLSAQCVSAYTKDEWFESLKKNASDEQLYHFLYAMPKGGDLHNHLSGAGLSEWWYELAVDKKVNRGYQYYTKVRINNCVPYGSNEFGSSPYLMLFHTLQRTNYWQLDDCQKSEYIPIKTLSASQKNGWLNSIRLDKPTEGRDEFFQRHWQRLGDLTANPYIMAELLFKNMQAFSAEGLVYLETQLGTRGYVDRNGSKLIPDNVADIFRQRLKQKDALETGVTVRLQYSLLRFIPDAEKDLEWMYRFVDRHRDLYVAVNMVGREDNDKGYPLRFLPTLRKLRQEIPSLHLSIHAGEVDEPNSHVRDTLLLGAQRIGHGVNLISDPDTMLLMRNGNTMVEINLVSNLLLNYVSDYKQHPFPEYLRFGIPVALSTDDRGMWDSNMTDEYFTALKHFNLSWEEIVMVGRNSIEYAFLEQDVKQTMLDDYDKRIDAFVKKFKRKQWKSLDKIKVVHYSFACKQYNLCQ